MAAVSVGDPPPVYYKGRKDKVCKAVFCIKCNLPYYLSDFLKQSEGIFIAGCLVVCSDHDNSDLTSHIDESQLCENSRVLIAQLKSINKEDAKKQLVEDIFNETNKTSHNATFVSEEVDIEKLVVENTLLKELNKNLNELNVQLKENNELLKDKFKNTNATVHKSTFAEVTALDKIKRQKIPKLIVKKTKENVTMEQVSKEITSILSKNSTIKSKFINKRGHDKLIINCIDNESIDKTIEEINSNLKDSCSIEKEVIDNPKMKLVGFDNCLNLDNETIEKDINTRNFELFDKKCKVLHSYINPKNKLQSVILEVPRDLHKYIKDNYNKICVGYQSCRLYDLINVKPCIKCGRLNHKHTKEKPCRNEICCLHCAGNHLTSACNNNNTKKCTNCIYINKTFHTTYNINHTATDSHECSVLKSRIKRYIDNTDYYVKPSFQRYHGMADLQKKKEETGELVQPVLTTVDKKISEASAESASKAVKPNGNTNAKGVRTSKRNLQNINNG